MASTYIHYNPSLKGGAAVYTAVNATLGAWYSAQRIKAEMDSLVGSPADYTQLEAPFGLVAGTGQAFYNTVVGMKANLDTTCASLNTLDQNC